MCSMQLANWVCSDRSIFASEGRWSNAGIRSSFWGVHLDLCDRGGRWRRGIGGRIKVFAMSSNEFKMNLNEYMVTLDKPLGIRFAQSVDGRVSVHALQKGGNAEKSRIIMVGDTLKKASEKSGGMLIEIEDLNDTENLIKEKSGTFSLVLERPYSPFPVHLVNEAELWFNRGRVSVTTWNSNLLASYQQQCNDRTGSSGFAIFSPKFLTSQGWRNLDNQEKNRQTSIPFSPLVAILTEEMLENAQWGHGSFPLDEYAKAWERSKEDLYYNHSLGMQYNKITEQIYVGSCIQSEKDVKTLSSAGITAVLKFQSAIEASNWGIDLNSINESCQKFNVLMINCPIRDADPSDLRKKLPFCAGLLLRLLRKNHRVYVTCTTGFDRSPACVIAYLHWMTDTSLHAAYSFVTGLHPCKPNRYNVLILIPLILLPILIPLCAFSRFGPAIVSGTWDLIAMVETGTLEQPTHSVIFVWSGFEGEDVCLVGDFTANWKEPIKAVHMGGSRYESEVRLSNGKYYYKYIINGNWRHSTSSPSERDESGNINNVIVVGDVASVKPSVSTPPTTKDANIVKVIERPLTENERFMLAKAARCITFLICPIRLHPK